MEKKQKNLTLQKSTGLTYEAWADESLYLYVKCLDTLWSVPHYHDSVEIVCAIEGEIKVHIDGKIYRLIPNQICFVNARQIHFYENYCPSAKIIVLTLGAEYTYHFRKQFPTKSFPVFMDNVEKNRLIIDFLINFEQQTTHTYLSVCGNMNLLLDLMMNIYPLAESSASQQKHLSREFIDYIQENYKKDVSLKAMAKDFGYTPEHFSKLFNNTVGMNFLTLLNSFRLQKVLELLNSPDNNKSLIQLSYECGFNSPATFYRYYSAYKKKMVDLPIAEYES